MCSFQFPGTSAEGLWPAWQHADHSVLLLPSLGLLCLNVTNVFIFMTVSCPVQGHKVLNAGHPSPPLSPPNPFHHPKPKLICIKYNSAPPTLPVPGLPCGSVTLAAVEMPVHGPHGTCAWPSRHMCSLLLRASCARGSSVLEGITILFFLRICQVLFTNSSATGHLVSSSPWLV